VVQLYLTEEAHPTRRTLFYPRLK